MLFFKAKPQQCQGGQATLVLAFFVVTFIVTCFLAVDIGNYYSTAHRLKRASDAAALRGWALLNAGSTEAEVQVRAENLARFNFPGTISSVAVSFPAAATVSVNLAATVPTIFLRLIPGNSQLDLDFTSTAVSSGSGTRPQLQA